MGKKGKRPRHEAENANSLQMCQKSFNTKNIEQKATLALRAVGKKLVDKICDSIWHVISQLGVGLHV